MELNNQFPPTFLAWLQIPGSLLFWLAPAGATNDLWSAFSGQARHPFAEAGLLLAWYIAMSIVEPFHVAAGFSLYLNRRTELEAWDLELAFRRLRERLGTGSRPE